MARGSNWLAAALAFAALALTAPAAAQQLTAVTGTITDPNTLPYSGATLQAVLITAGGASPTLTPCTNNVAGCAIQQQSPAVTLSPTGTFSLSLWANGSILPAGSTYTFILSTRGVPPPFGFGPLSFQVTGVTISGASQNVSATISGAAPAQTFAFSGGTGSFGALGGGTNNSATMICGTGCSLAPGGTGTLTATGFATVPTNCGAGVMAIGILANGNATGCFSNAPTASALNATPTNCGAGVMAIGILANGNATGCFTTAPTASALASTPTNCGAGVMAIGILANGNATGCFSNAPTASALQVTPTNCGPGNAAIGVQANGNATGCFTPPGFSALQTVGITSTSISNTTATLLATVTVAQPSSTCTWRIFANYAFGAGGGSNQSHVSAALWDGTNSYLPSDNGSSNGSSGGYSQLSASGQSSVTYSSATSSVTLKLYAQSVTTTNPSTLTSTGVTFGSPISSSVPFQLQAFGACMN